MIDRWKNTADMSSSLRALFAAFQSEEDEIVFAVAAETNLRRAGPGRQAASADPDGLSRSAARL